ncbi:Pentatricopeptide repeat-containing protein, partial [Glycine soja]
DGIGQLWYSTSYVTLVSVLSACSRGGEVERGLRIFESMRGRYGIEPGAEHNAWVVDLLGRSGLVDRAYEFIKRMPILPTISVWGALLGAPKMHGKAKLGKFAAEKSLILMTLGIIWEEATIVRKEMRDIGIKKNVGYSWVAVKNRVHVFQAKDSSHEKNSDIKAMLAKLKGETKKAGYVGGINGILCLDWMGDYIFLGGRGRVMPCGGVPLLMMLQLILIQGWEMCGSWKVFYGGYCSCHGDCAEPYEGQFKAGVDNENLWTMEFGLQTNVRQCITHARYLHWTHVYKIIYASGGGSKDRAVEWWYFMMWEFGPFHDACQTEQSDFGRQSIVIEVYIFN